MVETQLDLGTARTSNRVQVIHLPFLDVDHWTNLLTSLNLKIFPL